VSKEQLLALAEKVPGAWVGIKIATSFWYWRGNDRVDLRSPGPNPDECKPLDAGGKQGRRRSLVPKKQPGRPVRMTPKIVAQLELHLEESPQKFG